MKFRRFWLVAAFSGLVAVSLAAPGVILMTSFPTVTVADGRSTITVKAEVRDATGRLVPDGTPVVFETTLGTFRQSIVNTINGYAATTLVASSSPGVAKITATASEFSATAFFNFEFVKDRSMLSSAREYIEVVSPQHLLYSPERRLIEASSSKNRATLHYKDVEIFSGDMQVSITDYRVRTRKATLRINRVNRDFDELSYDLKSKTGVGICQHEALVPTSGFLFPFFRIERTPKQVYGPVDIVGNQISSRDEAVAPTEFKFADLSEITTAVRARKIVAFPRRDLQFQKADVLYEGQRVMSVPLYQMPANSSLPALSDQVFQMSGNQLAINYPYYLTMKPGQSSLLRLRLGNRYMSAAGSSGGTFLDYELRWNQGDDMDGGLDITGITRKDWGIATRQYLRIDDRTTGTLQVDYPAHRSLFGSTNVTRQFNGFAANYSANIGKSTRGVPFRSQQQYLVVEKDPLKLGKFPAQLFMGMTASTNSFSGSGVSTSQSSYGLRGRLQSNTLNLSKTTSVNSELSVARLFGKNVNSGLTTTGSMTTYTSFGPNMSGRLTYEFRDDKFNARTIGRHGLSMSTRMYRGPFELGVTANRSLDIQRLVGWTDVSYRISPLLRLASTFTFERFKSSKYSESTFLVGYTLGIREVGLSYSTRTRRLGVEILGSTLR